MTTGDAIPSDVLFAAGLLTSNDSLTPQWDTDKLLDKLDELIKICANSGPGGPTEPPYWATPDLELTARIAPRLHTAWQKTVQHARDHDVSVLYVRVTSAEDAVQLAQWDHVTGLQLVASMPEVAAAFDAGGDGLGGELMADVQEQPLAVDTDADTPRQLIAEFFRKNAVCSVLTPGEEHTLAVRIAVPRAGQRGIDFDEDDIAFDADGAADLIIDVTSDDGTFHATRPMVLPQDRSRPSTTATFPVRAADDGTILELNITVLYRNRPIRAGRVVAVVRSVALPDDEVQFWPIGLSSPSEPTAVTTADAALDDNGVTLSVRGTDHADGISLAGAENWSKSFEQVASQVLGTDYAPGSITDPEAVRLLTLLARRGSQFAKKLAQLGLQDARTISVMVRYDAPVLPLELAYDGPTPTEKAVLCSCAGQPGDQPCTRRPSRRRVCPWAFWGMNRVIARTVRFGPQPATDSRPKLADLALRPVVYAAADRADKDSPDGQLPSALLQSALSQRVGATNCTRVESWPKWRSAVKQTNPQLLVVLGHTDQAESEFRIEIGQHSTLSQPDISERELGVRTNPAPIVLLFACDSAISGDVFGALPSTFILMGAAAVVATLTKFKGEHASRAGIAVVSALFTSAAGGGLTLGSALTRARRELIANGLLVGLLLVAVGEIDLKLVG
ncbi:hypothetical protein A5666_27210 [Mycolicibacterium fortuitum]|uniref:hypothetical protein n=1 Tax=Mycolicibacterium fortuitum TaxID=1766 RepID=UPI0007EB45C2|nr:hypothetical protein [Mycolicibacterium fortuitum]OBA98758.1 hypothetical protein A5665_24370 [Mycolicibacterium fortuitum]OBI68748.1 hypothetical protein A5666_27210 [Mycolicibacterium fortuitum]